MEEDKSIHAETESIGRRYKRSQRQKAMEEDISRCRQKVTKGDISSQRQKVMEEEKS